MTAQDKAIQPAEIQAGHTPLAFDGPAGPLSPGIAIVGAGFSGTLLALHLLQRVPLQTRVVLIERNAQFGRGPAYSTGNSSHVLNVPAGKMSAFHSRPLDFLQWLQAQPPEELCGVEATASTFVPRRMFGRYIRHLLNQEVKARNHGDQFELIRGDVTDIATNGGGLSLTLDRNRTVDVDRAVLAIGNFPPAPPPVADMSFYDSTSYRPDPWAADTLDDLDPDLPVLLIGTGLTTIDTVISLLDQGHRGPITALSRRGLVPHRHASSLPPPDMPEADSFPTRVNDLARALREGSRRCRELGGNWHTVIDELRPITTELWQAMCTRDRARFLRHMRPWWDVHRHRVAGPVADRIDAARARGQLQIRAGRIREYREHPDGLTDILYRPRFGDGWGAGEDPRRPGGELRGSRCGLQPDPRSSGPFPAGQGTGASGPALPGPRCNRQLRHPWQGRLDLAAAVRGRTGDQGYLLGDDRGAGHPPASRVPGRAIGLPDQAGAQRGGVATRLTSTG